MDNQAQGKFTARAAIRKLSGTQLIRGGHFVRKRAKTRILLVGQTNSIVFQPTMMKIMMGRAGNARQLRGSTTLTQR
jgi:hypothetical protein